jgi:predicted methyltransferase
MNTIVNSLKGGKFLDQLRDDLKKGSTQWSYASLFHFEAAMSNWKHITRAKNATSILMKTKMTKFNPYSVSDIHHFRLQHAIAPVW